MEIRGSVAVDMLREQASAGARPGDPAPLTLWRHPKTKGWYFVVGVATCSTNGDREGIERSVVYWSFKYRGLRYREVGEFMDGRFVEEEH